MTAYAWAASFVFLKGFTVKGVNTFDVNKGGIT